MIHDGIARPWRSGSLDDGPRIKSSVTCPDQLIIDAMKPPDVPFDATTATRRTWLPHVVWAALVVVPFAGYLAWLSQTTLPSGQCSGIGWGCALAGWDAVGVALIILGVPLAAIWLIGHVVIALIQRCRRRNDEGKARIVDSVVRAPDDPPSGGR